MISKPAALRTLLALSALLVLTACIGSASASAAQWYTGTTETNGTLLTSKEPVSTALAIENNGSFKTGSPGWHGIHVVWSFWGGQMVTEVSGAECVSCSLVNTAEGAIGEGKLKFTGAKLYGLPSCTVEGDTEVAGTLVTKQIKWKLVTKAEKQYVILYPVAGELTELLRMHISGPGCETAAGYYSVRGTLAAESWAPGAFSPWSQAAKQHGLTLSAEAQTASGYSLKSGEKSAWFEGSLVDSLPSGKYWNAK